MPAPPNLERIVEVLVDAYVTGSDQRAARRWGVTVRTLRRYRAQLEEDDVLAALYARQTTRLRRNWDRVRLEFLTAATQRCLRLLRTSTSADLGEITRAIKTIGELELTTKALRAPAAAHQDQGPAAPAAAPTPAAPTGAGG